MKRFLFLLATVGLLMTACEGDWEKDSPVQKIELSQQIVDANYVKFNYVISVTSPYIWEAESKNDWIVVNTITGLAGTTKLSFSVERNELKEERTGTIVIKNSIHNLYAELHIVQMAFEPMLEVATETLAFTETGGEKEVKIIANIDFEINSTEDWLSVERSENNLKVITPTYYDTIKRTANIIVSNETHGISKTIKVSQVASSSSLRTIYYTTWSDEIMKVYNVSNAGIISNTYKNGQGQIVFDAPVTNIKTYAFYSSRNLRSIIIPASVTTIEEEAFSFCPFENITLGNSLKKIGKNAFSECDSLKSIIIPESVTSIGEGAFSVCDNLTSVTIPNGIKSIEEHTFFGCKNLKSITIPESVTSIGERAFAWCNSLKSITLGNGIKSIGEWAFNHCQNLTNITIPNSVTSIGECIFRECSNLESVIIGNGLTEISLQAFYKCENLKSVIIGDGVKSIGSTAFCDCNSLTDLTFGNNIVSIGPYAFFQCDSLKSVTIPNSVTSIGYCAFCQCSSLADIAIGNGVTFIDYHAFSSCNSLTSVTIPDNVKSIGTKVFSDCQNLTNVIIGNGLTTIGGWAFDGCCNLTNITIPESVTSIGERAFAGCNSLSTITIPESVVSIGDSAFSSCQDLWKVYCKATTPPSGGTDMFHANFGGRKIYVPTESVEAYKAADGWKNYASYIVGYDF